MIAPLLRRTAFKHIDAAAAFRLIALHASGLRTQQISIQWLINWRDVRARYCFHSDFSDGPLYRLYGSPKKRSC